MKIKYTHLLVTVFQFYSFSLAAQNFNLYVFSLLLNDALLIFSSAATVKFALATKKSAEKPRKKDIEEINSIIDKVEKEEKDGDNKNIDLVR